MGNGTATELKAILVAPVSVGGPAALADSGVGVGEHKPKVDLRVLRLDPQMLVSVLCGQSAFGLDVDTIRQEKIGVVTSALSGLFKLDDFRLEEDGYTQRLKLLGYPLL